VTDSSCLNDGTYTAPGHDKHGLSCDDLVIQEIPPKLPPPQPPPTFLVNRVPCAPPPPITHTYDGVPCLALGNAPADHLDTVPTEEDILGREEDVLDYFNNTTDNVPLPCTFPLCTIPSGSLFLESHCSATPQRVAALHGPQDLCMDAWLEQLQALLPTPASICDSLVHIMVRPRICGLFGNGTRICAVGDTICSIQTLQHQQNLVPISIPTPKTACSGLVDSGANLCMTNNPNLLANVCPCALFTIAVATSNGQHLQTNVCHRRGLLPLPLLDGSFHYQTCYINLHASDTFIPPQAIIGSSNDSFDKWQMEGYTNGQPGLLTFYSPSSLLKISIHLEQQNSLYYCTTNTFTVDTNPWSTTSPFVGHHSHVPDHSLCTYGLNDATSLSLYGFENTHLL
jgi:hypothetical protein